MGGRKPAPRVGGGTVGVPAPQPRGAENAGRAAAVRDIDRESAQDLVPPPARPAPGATRGRVGGRKDGKGGRDPIRGCGRGTRRTVRRLTSRLAPGRTHL